MQSMVRVIQGTAEKAFIRLFHQLDNVWHIRWTVMTALTSPYERIDSLKIGAGMRPLHAGDAYVRDSIGRWSYSRSLDNASRNRPRRRHLFIEVTK